MSGPPDAWAIPYGNGNRINSPGSGPLSFAPSITQGRILIVSLSVPNSSLTGLGIASGPCAETIRLWLLRVGLFLLRRPLPKYQDWVYLLDLTIQLGQHKCLVILGVSLAQFRRNGCRLNHRDVYVLSVQVLTGCTAQTIYQNLAQVQKRTGTPLEVISDHGHDVRGGIRLLQGKFPTVTEIYDITHGL